MDLFVRMRERERLSYARIEMNGNFAQTNDRIRAYDPLIITGL